MNKRNLEILEYESVRAILAEFCASEEGKKSFLKMKPSIVPQEVELRKSLGKDWQQAIESDEFPILKSWPPINNFISKLRVDGTTLSIEELYSLSLFFNSLKTIQKWAVKMSEDCDTSNNIALLRYETLVKTIKNLPGLETAHGYITSIIDSSGALKELAELKKINAEIKKIKKTIDNHISHYVHNEQYKNMLQSPLPTIRNSRQVIAIRANFRGRIKGIVHELSQTGQTIYLEPEEVVEANNKLIAEEHRLAKEIARILKQTTAKIAPFYENIVDGLKKMIFLDEIFAAVSWGLKYSCVFTQHYLYKDSFFNEDLKLAIYKARHPLLAKKAVPIDLILNPKSRMLIITGPNTGGKTVSLKTVGLFALMNQSGWPLPAAENTVLPFFDYVGCDIGDEQSINQSLSTFSGHMKNISKILKKASKNSLVILDELGSGTDPQEGSAIAMAVLDALLDIGALVLVTTHHGVLKNYAYTKEECINASVEFDHGTLNPTYKIIMGIPGESHALSIAEKNGLPQKIVQKAKNYLVEERTDVSALIKGLTNKHEELDRLENKKTKEEKFIREQRRKTDLKELQLKQKELHLREQGYKKLDIFLNESRKRLENLVREIREGELTKEKTKEVKEWIHSLEEKTDKEYENLQAFRKDYQDAQSSGEKPLHTKDVSSRIEFVPGMKVLLGIGSGGSKKQGVLVRRSKKNSWIVSLDSIRLTYPEEEIQICDSDDFENKPSISIQTELVSTAKPVLELRLLGLRQDEALKALEEQMDAALISGLKEFSIIHGKGYGILQDAVTRYLLDSSMVKKFSFADPEFGGTGKTLVTLK